MTIGKTYAGYTIKNNLYEIQVLRRKQKHQRPRPVPHNLIWAMDLTGKTDSHHKQHTVLGIVEHHSRACLTLAAIADKSTITLLRHLFDLFERYQKPKIIRTDNEAVFTSRLFRLGLRLLRIKHQRTEICCPWQNGKVERFFGTLKNKLNQWEVDSFNSLTPSLLLFRFYYNHVRPHQYLNGLTPAEVWQGKTDFKRHNNKVYWFDQWDGLLTGYYLPP
jgi:transposase InsO family protein